MAIAEEIVESLRAKFEAVLPHLDERGQRLVLGAEARALGHGGIGAVARASGTSRSRISAGVAQLESGQEPLGRVRREGGGRKPAEQADPGLVAALLALVEPTRRGDPESPLCWTTLSTRKLAEQLAGAGHRVSHETVGKLLHAQGFSLQANAKTIEGGQHPDRDAQFGYLNEQATAHLSTDQPVISVDTKKKELIGAYKNRGSEWRPAGDPEHVKVHDFIDPVLGKANPYGVYDLAADTGWVSVGTGHAAFAVRSGRPSTPARVGSADGGGSNGYRTRAWKTNSPRWQPSPGRVPPTGLEQDRTPARNWQTPDQPRGHREHHRRHHHPEGLSVHAELDTNTYPVGVKIPDQTIPRVVLQRHDFHGVELHHPPPEMRVLLTGGFAGRASAVSPTTHPTQ